MTRVGIRTSLSCIKTSKSIYNILRGNIGHYYRHHFVSVCFVYFHSTGALSFFNNVIESVGLSAVTLLLCLINALGLHVVSIAKLYVIKNLNLN